MLASGLDESRSRIILDALIALTAPGIMNAIIRSGCSFLKTSISANCLPYLGILYRRRLRYVSPPAGPSAMYSDRMIRLRESGQSYSLSSLVSVRITTSISGSSLNLSARVRSTRSAPPLFNE